jgi:divalent metal cation (Fe/Co/Zn/Cd) transporter
VVATLIAAPSVDLPTAVIAAGGGAVALITHLAKATTRVAVNTSPEPVSNVAVSVVEDVAVAGVVTVAVINPWMAAAIALVLLLFGVIVALLLLRLARKGLRRLGYGRSAEGDPATRS